MAAPETVERSIGDGATREVAAPDLFASADASMDAEFGRVFGSVGHHVRAAVSQAAATEGQGAYDRFRENPDSFGTVVGNRSKANYLGGALEALDYSKSVHAAEQERVNPAAPGDSPQSMPGTPPPGAPRTEASLPDVPSVDVPREERDDLESARTSERVAETRVTGLEYVVIDSGRRAGVSPQVSQTATLDQINYEFSKSASYTDVVGPSPEHIVIAKGLSDEQVLTVLGTMQGLTDDRLVYSTQPNGSRRVSIASLGVGDKTAGTRLIRRLNSSDHSVTIDVNNSLGYFSGSSGNRAMAVNYTAAANGTGSDAIVNFDPSSNPSIPTVNPTTGNVSGAQRPNKIGLGHELIHVEHYMDGDYWPSSQTSSFTYKNASGVNVTQTQRTEELRTVGLTEVKKDDITENQLRSDNRLRKRGAY